MLRRQLTNITNSTFRNMMVSIKEVTRGDYFIPIPNLMQYQRGINKKLCKKLTILVVIICVEGESALREFLIAATQEGMDSEEYVYISIEGRRGGTFREISSLQAKKYVFLNQETSGTTPPSSNWMVGRIWL